MEGEEDLMEEMEGSDVELPKMFGINKNASPESQYKTTCNFYKLKRPHSGLHPLMKLGIAPSTEPLHYSVDEEVETEPCYGKMRVLENQMCNGMANMNLDAWSTNTIGNNFFPPPAAPPSSPVFLSVSPPRAYSATSGYAERLQAMYNGRPMGPSALQRYTTKDDGSRVVTPNYFVDEPPSPTLSPNSNLVDQNFNTQPCSSSSAALLSPSRSRIVSLNDDLMDEFADILSVVSNPVINTGEDDDEETSSNSDKESDTSEECSVGGLAVSDILRKNLFSSKSPANSVLPPSVIKAILRKPPIYESLAIVPYNGASNSSNNHILKLKFPDKTNSPTSMGDHRKEKEEERVSVVMAIPEDADMDINNDINMETMDIRETEMDPDI